ncbi:MAG: hypothetical protein IH820_11355 [Bacteroidetes bacterium]|nr:hypothetical protein [Bacteroidota bacterium]
MTILNPKQIRAARVLLDIHQSKLAEKAGLTVYEIEVRQLTVQNPSRSRQKANRSFFPLRPYSERSVSPRFLSPLYRLDALVP